MQTETLYIPYTGTRIAFDLLMVYYWGYMIAAIGINDGTVVYLDESLPAYLVDYIIQQPHISKVVWN